MTTFDLIDRYLFDYISTSHRVNLKNCGCSSMVEEMNEIRSLYNNSTTLINDVLRNCVCNRNGHQYCIPETSVKEAVDALLNSALISNGKVVNAFNDFEDLYAFIKSTIGNISGIGELTIYDVAKRIGHIIETPIYPKMYVYLSAGAKEEAEILLKKKGLRFREPINLFTPYFGTLPSIFIEDMLCIFKNSFANLSFNTHWSIP